MDEKVPAVEEPNVWVVECRNRYKCPKCNRGRNTDTQLGWNTVLSVAVEMYSKKVN